MHYVQYVFRHVDLCSVASGASYKLLVVVTYQPSECKLDLLVVNHLMKREEHCLGRLCYHQSWNSSSRCCCCRRLAISNTDVLIKTYATTIIGINLQKMSHNGA
jgi:hypothetical protein